MNNVLKFILLTVVTMNFLNIAFSGELKLVYSYNEKEIENLLKGEKVNFYRTFSFPGISGRVDKNRKSNQNIQDPNDCIIIGNSSLFEKICKVVPCELNTRTFYSTENIDVFNISIDNSADEFESISLSFGESRKHARFELWGTTKYDGNYEIHSEKIQKITLTKDKLEEMKKEIHGKSGWLRPIYCIVKINYKSEDEESKVLFEGFLD